VSTITHTLRLIWRSGSYHPFRADSELGLFPQTARKAANPVLDHLFFDYPSRRSPTHRNSVRSDTPRGPTPGVKSLVALAEKNNEITRPLWHVRCDAFTAKGVQVDSGRIVSSANLGRYRGSFFMSRILSNILIFTTVLGAVSPSFASSKNGDNFQKNVCRVFETSSNRFIGQFYRNADGQVRVEYAFGAPLPESGYEKALSYLSAIESVSQPAR
jgi:hypothetical protein